MATQLSLADLVGGLNNSNTQVQADISSLTQGQVDILQKLAERSRRAADDQYLVTSTEELAKANAQKHSAEASSLLGTNPDAASYVLSQYIQDKNALFAQARAELQEVNRKKATTLATPFDWLDAQLTIGNSINSYNAAATEYNLVGKQIDDLVSGTGEIRQMNDQMAITKTAATAAAAARVAQQQLLNVADKADIDALSTNAEGILRVQGLRQNQVDNAFKLQSAQNDSARLALAQQAAARDAARLSMAMKKEKADDNDKELAYTAWETFRKSAGMPVGGRAMFEMTYRADPDSTIGEINNGLRTLQSRVDNPGADARFLGGTPTEALTVASKYNMSLDAGRQKLLNFTNSVLSDLQRTEPDKMKSKASATQALNNSTMLKAAEQHGSITSEKNIYAPPSMDVLLADASVLGLKSTELVLKPLADSGVTKFEPRVVVPQIMEKVLKKEIPLDVALQDIDTIAKKSVLFNNEFHSYRNTLGIPNQTALNMQMDVTSNWRSYSKRGVDIFEKAVAPHQTAIFGGGALSGFVNGATYTTINLTDKAAVQDYANRYLAGKIIPNLKNVPASSKPTTEK